jgi:flagellum-specific peptidoglycan hydrolase FlgJ
MFGPYAKASEAKTGVPGLVTLAQAAVESGWGARAAGNNFFGIKAKASDAEGTRQLWRTREVLSRPDVRTFPEVISVKPRPDGRYDYVVRDWFRVFPSPELAFVGHGEFLRRNKRYAPAFGFGSDPYRFAAEVARAGYATDPSYTKVVHSVMRLLERSGWK